ncbi:MAG TPA: SPFH domain-containing protein [Candidatus Nanoarchaeia archaeon]|nr:SPFH domain-containing protein [Candidatus Nanoarchaeia archaeon]
MGFVLELVDILKKFKCAKVVYEYQQGLYLVAGKARKLAVRHTPEEIAEFSRLEQKLVEDSGGPSAFLFSRPEIPEDYHYSWINGLPIHNGRSERSRILRHGIYSLLPGLCEIITIPAKMKPLDLGSITVLSADDPPVPLSISCNLRYRVIDGYKAYVEVDDYEDSLKIETLSQLSDSCYGRKYNEWNKIETRKEVQEDVVTNLRELVTDQWGLEIFEVTITDVAPTTTNRLVYTGQPIPVTLTNENTSETED